YIKKELHNILYSTITTTEICSLCGRDSSSTSCLPTPWSHLRLISPQESRIFHLLGQFIPRLNKIQCAGQLIGTEGGDSCGNSKRSSVGRTIVQSHES